MTNNHGWFIRVLALTIVGCFSPAAISALPSCNEIFNESPKENAKPKLKRPKNLKNLGSIECRSSGECRDRYNPKKVYEPGDYSYRDGRIGDGGKTLSLFKTNGATTRLYFDYLEINNTAINENGRPEDLIIFVERTLKVVGNQKINAIVYAKGDVDTSGSDKKHKLEINGALVSGEEQNTSHIKVDAPLNDSAIADADFGPICENWVNLKDVDHVEFYYSSSPITCSAEKIALKLCADSSCSQVVNTTGKMNLLRPNSSGAFWVGGNTIKVANGLAQLNLRNTSDTDPVTLAADTSSINVNPLHFNLCTKGNNGLTNANCSFNFASSALKLTMPDVYANKPTDGYLYAIKSEDEGRKCVPEFANVTKPIQFSAQGINNAKRILPTQIKSGDSDWKHSGLRVNDGPINVQFDADGKGVFQAKFSDATLVMLSAIYKGKQNEQDKGLLMQGETFFVSSPVSFCVETHGYCESSGSDCSVFKKAGEIFDVKVSPVAWEKDNDDDYCLGNIKTSQFSHGKVNVGSSLVAPINGINSQKTTSYSHQYGGTNTIRTSIDEVGVFEVTAGIDGHYLGSSLPTMQGKSKATGRFVPAYFETSGEVMPGCYTGFTYMDSPFFINIKAAAKNAHGHVTRNYENEFAKASDFLSAEANTENLSLRLSPNYIIPRRAWNKGEIALKNNKVAFSKSVLGKLDGPFDKVKIGITIIDNDGDYAKTKQGSVNRSSSVCDTPMTCNAVELGQLDNVIYGRSILENTYGSSSEILKMNIFSQYWDGDNGWQINAMDSCTGFGTDDLTVNPLLAMQETEVNSGHLFEPALTGNQKIIRYASTSRNAFNQGMHTLLWESKDKNYVGSIQAPVKVPLWLQYQWNWSEADSLAKSDPRGSATFGVYKGNNKTIYWRDNSR